MKNAKIALPQYKILYSVCFIAILSAIRGITVTSEIGVALDPNLSLLAVIFCADTLECEYREKRWEVFCLLPKKSRIGTIRRRFWFQWAYLWLLGLAGYWLFYWQRPLKNGMSDFFLYGMFAIASAASILFWGALSMAMVNVTRRLLPGIGIAVLAWLLVNSKGGAEILGNLSVFAFDFRDIMKTDHYGWMAGKTLAAAVGAALLIRPAVLRRKG